MRSRRRFLQWLGGIAAGAAASGVRVDPGSTPPSRMSKTFPLFLCGDVMTGRAIDQILPHPSKPTLHEPYMQDARGYLAMAGRYRRRCRGVRRAR